MSEPAKHTLRLIGVDQGGLGEAAREAIARSQWVFCTERFRALLGDFRGTILPISPLAEALSAMDSCLALGDIVVLASGDPLFFGIGRTLIARFGAGRLLITPALSTLQLAFAHFKEPWEDAALLSLHGRDGLDILPTLLRRHKVFLLTDRHHRPEVIAQALATGLDDLGLAEPSCRIMVAENLGMADERIHHGSPLTIAGSRFAELNVMIVCLTLPVTCPPLGPLGLTEDEIAHSRGLITKDEVRAAILHHLRLPTEGVLWDIGAGSGSVAIEAARLCPDLAVYAIERQEEGQAHIVTNRRRFRLANLQLVGGAAPEALAKLPDPDRVFIGGSGGHLSAIVEEACQRLRVGGMVIASAVTPATRELAPRLLYQYGLRVVMVTITVCRESYPPSTGGPLSLNPITLIVGSL